MADSPRFHLTMDDLLQQQGLEIGRLDLKPGDNPEVIFRVDAAKLVSLALK